MVCLNKQMIAYLNDFHQSCALQKFRHYTHMVRIEVLNHDESHSAIHGHIVKKLLQSIQSACRSTNANYWKIYRR
jgi:hypothetical protein